MRSSTLYSLFDPVGNDDTKDVEREFNGDELSSGFVFSSLGGPNRNNSVEHSCTPSVDEPSTDHPSMVLSRSLESSADDSPTSSQTDGLDTSITITKPTTDETADESTEIIDRDDAALKESVVDDRGTCFGIGMTKFHGLLVVVNGAVDTTHHTLIISEKKDG